jgi:ABC-2 type transport system ATP-binding protein
MKRRVDLASALIHLPPVLFLDEPTEGLDPHGRAAIWDALERLKDALGMTVLMTTHYMEEADRLCDRIAIVDAGRIVVQGTPRELKGALDSAGPVTLENVYLHTTGRELEVAA